MMAGTIQPTFSTAVATIDVPMWGIHAGQKGEADTLFRQQGQLAIGWSKVGDLSKLKSDPPTFRAKVAECYPEKKPGAFPVYGGLLLRFAHLMQPGDVVVYPSKADSKVNIGRVSGAYSYRSDVSAQYPNLRSVTWVVSVPRTHFSQGALHEIGSALTLFQVRNYAEEFRQALEGKAPTAPVAADESVALVADEIELTTRDFVLKRLASELKGHPFADFVGHLLETMGYRTRVSPPGPDGGVDIVAHRDELGFEPPIIKVQVKSSEGSVGDPVVSALYGKVSHGEFGLLVSLGTVTSQAKSFATGKTNLRLIDQDELVELVLQHYDRFDSRYKALIPLKRVYVPQPIEEATD